MNKLLKKVLLFSLFFFNLQLMASDFQPIKPLGEKHNLIRALADAADFSNPQLLKAVVRLMTKTFSMPRQEGATGPNNSPEFIRTCWEIAKERASSEAYAPTCLNFLKEGYESIVYAFEHPQTQSIPNQAQMGQTPEYELNPLAFFEGHSPVVAILANNIDFSNLSPEKLRAIILEVPFKCSIDESIEHHPLLPQLKEKFRKDSMNFLIAALKIGSFCVKTRITEDDINAYNKSCRVRAE